MILTIIVNIHKLVLVLETLKLFTWISVT